MQTVAPFRWQMMDRAIPANYLCCRTDKGAAESMGRNTPIRVCQGLTLAVKHCLLYLWSTWLRYGCTTPALARSAYGWFNSSSPVAKDERTLHQDGISPSPTPRHSNSPLCCLVAATDVSHCKDWLLLVLHLSTAVSATSSPERTQIQTLTFCSFSAIKSLLLGSPAKRQLVDKRFVFPISGMMSNSMS